MSEIVTIGGKPLTQAEAEAIQAKRQKFPAPAGETPRHPPKTVKVPGESADEVVDIVEITKEATLNMLRSARNLVENDMLEGVIVIGRQKGGKGVFYTDLCLNRQIVSHNDLYAYVGVLDVLKRELGDIATMAPSMIEDGTIADPHAEPEEIA
jgi:hypothetical protein